MSSDPKVYVRCLSSYNSGKLHGKWISISGKTKDELQDEINELLSTSTEEPAEEWAIHDTEDLEGAGIREHTGLDTLAEFGAIHAENEDTFERVLALFNHFCGNTTVEDCLAYHNDNYLGAYSSSRDYAEEQWQNNGNLDSIPEHLRMYIDWDSVVNDMECNGEHFTIEAGGETHYYRSV
nr:antirestriction protein ArdA [Bdellovibrio sp. HM001]